MIGLHHILKEKFINIIMSFRIDEKGVMDSFLSLHAPPDFKSFSAELFETVTWCITMEK